MLLRNFNPAMGHCNGSRYIIEEFYDHCIKLRPLNPIKIPDNMVERGNKFAQPGVLYVPRVWCIPADKKKMPFTLWRKQFPLRPCYSFSINKSQGTTLAKAGVYLPTKIFAHGLAYCAASRTRSWNGLKFCLPNLKDDEDGASVIKYCT